MKIILNNIICFISHLYFYVDFFTLKISYFFKFKKISSKPLINSKFISIHLFKQSLVIKLIIFYQASIIIKNICKSRHLLNYISLTFFNCLIIYSIFLRIFYFLWSSFIWNRFECFYSWLTWTFTLRLHFGFTIWLLFRILRIPWLFSIWSFTSWLIKLVDLPSVVLT
jgi:hypothetical protein